MCMSKYKKDEVPPPGGLEPPTFRLTAERASRLRHGGMLTNHECIYVFISSFIYENNTNTYNDQATNSRLNKRFI